MSPLVLWSTGRAREEGEDVFELGEDRLERHVGDPDLLVQSGDSRESVPRSWERTLEDLEERDPLSDDELLMARGPRQLQVGGSGLGSG